MNTPANPKYRIIVVDDDLDLNTTFALMLEFDGHHVQTANNGEAALQMLTKEHFDLLITEYWLPRIRGDELAAFAKEKWPELAVIVITSDIEEINTDAHPLHDIDCLLDKPFSMGQLREAMKWALNRTVPHTPEEVQAHWVHSGHTATADSPHVAQEETDRF